MRGQKLLHPSHVSTVQLPLPTNHSGAASITESGVDEDEDIYENTGPNSRLFKPLHNASEGKTT